MQQIAYLGQLLIFSFSDFTVSVKQIKITFGLLCPLKNPSHILLWVFALIDMSEDSQYVFLWEMLKCFHQYL